MAVTPDGRIFAPIFEGQLTDEPEYVAQMASNPDTKFHPEYIMSHGGAWRDPFTGERIGGVQDLWGRSSAGEELNPYFPNINPNIVRDPDLVQDIRYDESGELIGRFIPEGFRQKAEEIYQANLARHRGLDVLASAGIDASTLSAQERLAWTNLLNLDPATMGADGDPPDDGDPSDDGDPPDDPTDTDEFRSLKEVFLGGLEQIGLDDETAQSLWDWAERRFVADSSFTAAQANVEMKDQKAFKDRFPGIASMRAELDDEGSPAARRDIPTPGEYLARERLWATHLGKYGMSALGADLNTMVAQSYMKSIGEGEFVDRLKAASEMIYEAPEAVKNTFGDWFGNHADAALMAVFLDPSNEVFNDDWIGLKGDVAAAEVGGWSKMHLGLDAPVTQERSRAIAGLGWRDIDIWEGLDALKAKEDLFIERIGEVDYQMEVEGVAAEFGIDTETLSGVELNELIDRRASRRSADFSGGGGAMLTGTTTGFGAANA